MRLLDLFCGRFGWSRAFAARGWECYGVDLTAPPDTPSGCHFFRADVLTVRFDWRHRTVWIGGAEWRFWPDFIVASSPCEEFSVHGMKNFHPNPKAPKMGIKLFNDTRDLCEAANVPYVMENVRAAERFVGPARSHCGPFYLWGSAVPPLLPQGIRKGRRLGISGYRVQKGTNSLKEAASRVATIPPELANCVADYAERLIGSR